MCPESQTPQVSDKLSAARCLVAATAAAMLPNLGALSLSRKEAPTDTRLGDALYIDFPNDAVKEEILSMIESKGVNQGTCAICFESLNKNDPPWTGEGEYNTVACIEMHIYHKRCLKPLVDLNEEPKCPECRRPVLAEVVQALRGAGSSSAPETEQVPEQVPEQVQFEGYSVRGAFWVPGPSRWHLDIAERMLRGINHTLGRVFLPGFHLGYETNIDGQNLVVTKVDLDHYWAGPITRVNYQFYRLTEEQADGLIFIFNSAVMLANAGYSRLNQEADGFLHKTIFRLEGPPHVIPTQRLHRTLDETEEMMPAFWQDEPIWRSRDAVESWKASWPERTYRWRFRTLLASLLYPTGVAVSGAFLQSSDCV